MNMNNLYLLWQCENRGYDTYDSCVVVAEDEKSARCIHPSQYIKSVDQWFANKSWASDPSYVQIEYLGVAKTELMSGTVICASFNAG